MFELAEKVLNTILQNQYMIILPPLIYVEVINALKRLGKSRSLVDGAKKYIAGLGNVHICSTTSDFWINEISDLDLSEDVKASDLIIIAHAIKFRAQLVSFDKKMMSAYNKITD